MKIFGFDGHAEPGEPLRDFFLADTQKSEEGVERGIAFLESFEVCCVIEHKSSGTSRSFFEFGWDKDAPVTMDINRKEASVKGSIEERLRDKIRLTKMNYDIVYAEAKTGLKEDEMLEVTDNAISFLSKMMEQMGGGQKIRLAMMET